MKKRFHIPIIWSLIFAFLMTGSALLQAQAASKADYSAVFDADYYYNAYEDLRQVIGNDKAALLRHFTAHGMREGRTANAAFNVNVYMANNPDLIQAFGTEDLSRYYLHYINHGQKEGRIAADGSAAPATPGAPAAASPQGSLISSYSTAYAIGQSRAVNIALAVSKINGVVVAPGESFSYDNTVGPRTTSNGFVVAPVFVNKRVSQGVGGGICQVSSTMYAAMLQGGIAATERHPHSLSVSYIPAGMDATVVRGVKDLKFTNTFDYPIVIQATAVDGTVTVSFLRQ